MSYPVNERTESMSLRTYESERRGRLEYRYGRDGSLTILDMRKRAGTMRTVLYVRNSPATDAYWKASQ